MAKDVAWEPHFIKIGYYLYNPEMGMFGWQTKKRLQSTNANKIEFLD
jgi:hypothetical protein